MFQFGWAHCTSPFLHLFSKSYFMFWFLTKFGCYVWGAWFLAWIQALKSCLFFTLPCTQGRFLENLVVAFQAFFVVDDVFNHLHIMVDQFVWHHHELLSWARVHNICVVLMHILPLVEMCCKWKLEDDGGNLRVSARFSFSHGAGELEGMSRHICSGFTCEFISWD
jgi:hypothetical protein